SLELVAGGDVDVSYPFRPGSAPEVERVRVPRKRGASLAERRVDAVSELGRRRPRIVGALTRRSPDVLPLRSRPVRREDHLPPVLAHVRLDLIRGAVELGHEGGRSEE